MEIIVRAVIGIIATALIYYIFLRKPENAKQEVEETVANTLELKLRELMPELQKQANEALITLADQKLGAEKKEIRTDIENKREEIERLVKVIKSDLKESKESLDKAEKERVGSFMALKNKLDEYKKITDQLAVSTDNLRKVLSNNQLRGQFGEQVAEDLLKMTGFVKGVDYDYNKAQGTVDTRPDFTIKLPDGTKINVDAKFPYAQLQKVTEAESQDAKAEHMKLFERDVKEKIKQVTNRDYINPEENTVDFVILFIPNEMIFSFIYDKMNDLWTEAMRKKVVFAGPFSFTAILRMVRQAYDNFKYQSNIREIIGHVKSFEKEFKKFYDSFSKIGDRIESLQKQYNTVATTRVNQLTRKMDKVQLTEDVKQLDE
ncbi:DNA recombination protein RmuC [Candidatus Dojkabacteria bacterium]|nr:DNA recombination protein RmuC [Candidatus Dojkabacteria bacterium]